MSQLAEIEARLLPMEPLIDKLGGDPSQSIRHVESVPTEACNNDGKIAQELLYDFWRRLEIKGSPHHKNIEELLTQVRRVVEERGIEMPRRIYDKIRSIQATRNRATHLAPEETTVDDAIESLKQLGDIAAWYFFKYLGETPSDSAELAKAEPARRPSPLPRPSRCSASPFFISERPRTRTSSVGRMNRCSIGWKPSFELPATPYLSIDTWSSGSWSSGTRAPTSLPPVIQAYSGDRLCHRGAPLHHRYESIALQCGHPL